eukprot:gene6079-6319_t
MAARGRHLLVVARGPYPPAVSRAMEAATALATKGHVIKQLADGKLGCVAGAVFIPDNPLQPQGAGVWVDDVFNESPPPACNGSQACWDMCFW